MISYYSNEEKDFLEKNSQIKIKSKFNLKSFLIKILVLIFIVILGNVFYYLNLDNSTITMIGAYIFLISLLGVLVAFILSIINKNRFYNIFKKSIKIFAYLFLSCAFMGVVTIYFDLKGYMDNQKCYTCLNNIQSVYKEINVQMDNFNSCIIDDTSLFFDTSQPTIYIEKLDKYVDLSDTLKYYDDTYYYVAVIKNNHLEYLLFSNEHIKENQVREYSYYDQLKTYKFKFIQDISCYPCEY